MADNSDDYVLLIDDHPKNIQVLGSVLKNEGYRIGVAHSGEEALSQIRKKCPDLILLDVMMPEMDGFHLCEVLKNDSVTKDVPIIFLTIRNNTEDIVKGLELGAVDYVTKPFNNSELIMRVRSHLELRRKTRLLKQHADNQKQLIHVLCHDLTNPIHGILSYLTLIRKNEFASGIQQAAGNCIKIIDVVRTIFALDVEKFHLNVMPVNLETVFNEAFSLVQRALEQKRITLHPPDFPDQEIWVIADEEYFGNFLLVNLLTNAIKYSKIDSEIEVSLNTSSDGLARLSIKDHGIGMTDALIDEAMSISNSNARIGTLGESGTGFSLPLVEKLMTFYGGSFLLQSKSVEEFSTDPGTIATLELNIVESEE